MKTVGGDPEFNANRTLLAFLLWPTADLTFATWDSKAKTMHPKLTKSHTLKSTVPGTDLRVVLDARNMFTLKGEVAEICIFSPATAKEAKSPAAKSPAAKSPAAEATAAEATAAKSPAAEATAAEATAAEATAAEPPRLNAIINSLDDIQSVNGAILPLFQLRENIEEWQSLRKRYPQYNWQDAPEAALRQVICDSIGKPAENLATVAYARALYSSHWTPKMGSTAFTAFIDEAHKVYTQTNQYPFKRNLVIRTDGTYAMTEVTETESECCHRSLPSACTYCKRLHLACTVATLAPSAKKAAPLISKILTGKIVGESFLESVKAADLLAEGNWTVWPSEAELDKPCALKPSPELFRNQSVLFPLDTEVPFNAPTTKAPPANLPNSSLHLVPMIRKLLNIEGEENEEAATIETTVDVVKMMEDFPPLPSQQPQPSPSTPPTTILKRESRAKLKLVVTDEKVAPAKKEVKDGPFAWGSQKRTVTSEKNPVACPPKNKKRTPAVDPQWQATVSGRNVSYDRNQVSSVGSSPNSASRNGRKSYATETQPEAATPHAKTAEPKDLSYDQLLSLLRQTLQLQGGSHHAGVQSSPATVNCEAPTDTQRELQETQWLKNALHVLRTPQATSAAAQPFSQTGLLTNTQSPFGTVVSQAPPSNLQPTRPSNLQPTPTSFQMPANSPYYGRGVSNQMPAYPLQQGPPRFNLPGLQTQTPLDQAIAQQLAQGQVYVRLETVNGPQYVKVPAGGLHDPNTIPAFNVQPQPWPTWTGALPGGGYVPQQAGYSTMMSPATTPAQQTRVSPSDPQFIRAVADAVASVMARSQGSMPPNCEKLP